MLCQNCGKNEVNFRYTQIINGVKKEMALCDKCAKSLGLENLDFNMPINFSSFLGDFFGGTESADFLPSFTKTTTMQCENCGTTYDEFIDTGKFGCSHCYDIFADGLDSLLKNIHGSARHVGRRSNLSIEDKKTVEEDVAKVKGKKAIEVGTNKTKSVNQENSGNQESQENEKQNNSKEKKIKQLNVDLKKAIKEERYEDAAKIRDEIKKLS